MAKRIHLCWPMLACALLVLPKAALALVYCTITEVKTEELSNGVQITVKADGLLTQYGGWRRGEATNRYETTFNNARNGTGQNFIDVSCYPVSHIELSTPEGAVEGVGVKLVVAMYEPCPVSTSYGSDRQSMIITVSSDRTLEGRKKHGKKAEGKQESELLVEVKEDRVSVTAVKTDVQKVLSEIAQRTGANLAVDDAVTAEVNLHLSGLTVAELLKAIAGAYGLAFSEEGGVYMFSRGVPQDLAAYRLSGTASHRLRYTRAQTASGLLPTFLYSYLHVNQGQNAIVITAPQQMLDKISADLQAVDVAPPQILIEAIACEFTDSQELDKMLQALRGDVTGKTTEEGYPEYSGVLDTRLGWLSYATIGDLPNDFEARLRLLETRQKARVKAAPRMAVMNGQQADLFIGVRRFIRVEVLSYGQSTEKIQGIDVGVKLKVTPLTGGGGEITLRVDPEESGVQVSNVSELDPFTGLPVLSTRQAGTTVRVKDGETVMFGGLSQKQYDDRVTKIPVLGDLPLIGTLFQGRSRSEVTSELVVFITPHILSADGRLADEAQENAIRQRFGVE